MAVSFGLVLLALLAIACGGGGGGGESSAKSFEGSYYTVDFSGATTDQPLINSSYSASVSFDLDGEFITSSRELLVGVNADAGELTPRIRLSLKYGGVSGGNLSGNYNGVIYGLPDLGGKVAVAQYNLDFSTSTPSANTVMVADNAAPLTAKLPGSGNTFQLDAQGAIQWGDWQGGVSQNGNTLLLSSGNLFLLGSKVAADSQDLSSKVFQNSASVFQVDGDPGTALSKITFTTTQMSLEIDDDLVSTPGNVPNSNVTRGFSQTGTGSSLIILTHETIGDQREQGFVGSEEFFVVINPDNSDRPTLSVGFLSE